MRIFLCGQKRHWWRYYMKMPLLVIWYAFPGYFLSAVPVWKGRFSDDVSALSGRTHNIFNGFRVICHTSFSLKTIKELSLSYYTSRPASHNIFMDTKGVWSRPGTMCYRVVSLGRHGRSKLPVLLEPRFSPSGKCTTRGLVYGWIFFSGALGRIKWPVAPVSVMACLTAISILDVLNIISEWADSRILCVAIIFFVICFMWGMQLVSVSLGL